MAKRQPSQVGLFTLLTKIQFKNGGKSLNEENTSEHTTDTLQLVLVKRTPRAIKNVTRWRWGERNDYAYKCIEETVLEKQISQGQTEN